MSTYSTDLDTLTDFFARYGSALTSGDVAGIAGCYALPGLVVSGSYSFSFTSPAAVALSFLGASGAYQDNELIAAHAQLREVRTVGDGLMLVAVTWEYLDCRGQRVPGEEFSYLIRGTETGPAICVVMRG